MTDPKAGSVGAPSIEDLKQALTDFGACRMNEATAYEHGDRLSERNAARESDENKLVLLAALDELAALRESQRELVEALEEMKAAHLREDSHHELLCSNCKRANAALRTARAKAAEPKT